MGVPNLLFVNQANNPPRMRIEQWQSSQSPSLKSQTCDVEDRRHVLDYVGRRDIRKRRTCDWSQLNATTELAQLGP